MTTPKDADTVCVTEQDTHTALAPFALGTWGRIQRRFSSIFRRVAGTGRTNRFLQESDKNPPTANPASTSNGSKVKRHHSLSSAMARRNKQGHGNTSTSTANDLAPSLRQRPQSIERSTLSQDKAGSSSRTAPVPITRKTRRDSDALFTITSSAHSASSGQSVQLNNRLQDNVSSSDAQPTHWIFAGVRKWAGRSSLEMSTPTSTSRGPGFDAPIRDRRSEEALWSRHSASSDKLTNAKRTLSWGAPTDPDDDEESQHSDVLGEVEMRIGAGGFADPPNTSATIASNASRALSPDSSIGRTKVRNPQAHAFASPSGGSPASVPVRGAAAQHTTSQQRTLTRNIGLVMSTEEDDPCSWTEETDSSGDRSPYDPEDSSSAGQATSEDRDEGEGDENAQIVMRTKPSRLNDSSE